VIINKILSKLLPLVIKEVTKKLSSVKNDIIPLKKYVEEPNENNIAIDKIKDELIFMKNKIKQMDSKANRKKDKKWYDD
jgi:hypothetical protein|tara:strand:+ start:4392 stop:4628 length:237 start_codon:yes stop_codon:yes gene_type:complete